MDIIKWLSNWFAKNCDGDWEHNAGITISTLDNPGWCLKVSITGTSYEGKLLSVNNFQNETDWYEIKCDGNIFTGYGDASKLILLVEYFKDFVETTSSK